MMFGTWGTQTGKGILDISDDLECPICLEVKRSISQPNCEHTTCIDCFKRCHYGDDDTENEPKFPYPDIEDKYYNDNLNNRLEWENKYPLIKKWNEDWDKWDYNKQNKYESEENIRNCPLCRR